MGWTLNFALPVSYLIIIAILVLAIIFEKL